MEADGHEFLLPTNTPLHGGAPPLMASQAMRVLPCQTHFFTLTW